MESKCNKCRFCRNELTRKSKNQMIDEEIKFQFTQLTNLNLYLKTHWEAICNMCLRSLQLACDFQEHLIANEENYRKENTVEGETDYSPIKLIKGKRKAIVQVNVSPVKKKAKVNKKEVKNKTKESVSQTIKREKQKIKSKIDLNNNGDDEDDDEKSKKEFKCFHCPLIYSTEKLRLDHIYVHHIKRRFPCPVINCNHETMRRCNLISHIKNKHCDFDSSEMKLTIDIAQNEDPTYENPNLRTE